MKKIPVKIGNKKIDRGMVLLAFFKTSIAEVENAYENLANAHHIALAPGSYSIWMAHPFSGLPTNYVAKVGNKRFWGN